jgi:hypothetical protein
LGPEQIKAIVTRYQEEFRARPKVQALYAVAAPYQKSVIDRFATVASACRMAIDAGLLWKNADTDADIDACVVRWAECEKMDAVVAAIAHFMRDRQSWQGTASELKDQLNGAIDSAEAVGRWLKQPENQRRLKLSGLEVRKRRSKGRDRSKLILIERIGGQLDGSDSISVSTAVDASSSSQATQLQGRGRKGRYKVRPIRPTVREPGTQG